MEKMNHFQVSVVPIVVEFVTGVVMFFGGLFCLIDLSVMYVGDEIIVRKLI